MSTIIHPIHTASQKLRPKHQVLVLKCYPKFQKTVQEVKPNSSELSYLLYYASTRRTKLQKIGAFLDKKTVSNVWRGKLGNIQVTLQILTALIEKCSRDLPLYSKEVLSIFDTVVHSKDISIVEESIPAFETYCKYLSASSLSADKARAEQFLNVVETYTAFASKGPFPGNKTQSKGLFAIRWRASGLTAIKSVVTSDAFAAESGKQLSIVMPVILENLYSDEGDVLASLQQRAQNSEKVDVEKARQRRMSIATVTTVDTVENNPGAAAGTTADADKVAEEEVRVLAVRCLKQIFAAGTGSNRGQIRLAAALTLRFIATRNPPLMTVTRSLRGSGKRGNWATSLIETVTRWTPVQDRFIILVTAMETLVRSPIQEQVLEKQLALATMIDWLLSSSINLIGLSVMDVLIGFVQHTLLLLQLGGRDSKIIPHYQQSDALDLYHDTKESFEQGSVFEEIDRGRDTSIDEATPSPVRLELLLRLQKCIGNLATHIYYTDQITDMMTAILARLKPSVQSDLSSTVAAIDDPTAAARAIARSASLQEDPATHGFFSFATARVTALRAIKDILIATNFRRTSTGTTAEARSRVGVQVWEGTQWLLRDDDREVRFAYVDALLTWLRLETNKADSHLPRDGPRKSKTSKKASSLKDDEKLARRAASNASRRDTQPAKSTFLNLLHLAIYDNALESPDCEADILLLHLLMSTMIERLGVNTVRPGLSMIFQLQEIALNNDSNENPRAKINLASLVHGYFWALAEKFDFEATRVGNEINQEIGRRKKASLWLEKVRFPALGVDDIATPSPFTEKLAVPVPGNDLPVSSIKPYLNRFDLVLEIANAYDASLVTPVVSPPASPGRVFSVPTLGFGYGYGISPPRPAPENQMPQKIKDELLLEWTRESCIACVEKESTKTASISGSKTATSSGARNHLTVNGAEDNEHDSPRGSQHERLDSPVYGPSGGLGNLQKLRRVSTNGSPVPLTASSSRESIVRVVDLKRALTGFQTGVRHPSPLRRPASGPAEDRYSNDSDSMVNYSDADGFGDSTVDLPVGKGNVLKGPSDIRDQKSQPLSPSNRNDQERPRTAPNMVYDTVTLPKLASDPRLGEGVPPVPEIPPAFNVPGTFPEDPSPTQLEPPLSNIIETQSFPRKGRLLAIQADSGGSRRTSQSLREGRSRQRGNLRPTSRRSDIVANSNGAAVGTGKVDIGRLLAGIDVRSNRQTTMEEENSSDLKMSVPPY